VFNYARGVTDDDAAVKSEARSQLDDYVTDLSEFLADATHQAIPVGVVAEELRVHVDHLLQVLRRDQHVGQSNTKTVWPTSTSMRRR
jgi:hypothetical protein